MSALEQALDQHLRMADKTYDEWEEYLDIIDPVKYIKLTQGKYAIVDTELFDWLNQWKWYALKRNNTYYAARKDKQSFVFMHREILGLKQRDGKITDHINRDGLDNRLSNLRTVSKSVNARNHKGHSNNTSGHNGVCWNKAKNKWQAYIDVNGNKHILGLFENIQVAVKVRKQAEAKYW